MRPVDRERHARRHADRQTAAAAALLFAACCTGSASQARRQFLPTPLTPHAPKSIGLHLPRFRCTFSHFFVDSLQQGNRFNGACAATSTVLPLPRPFCLVSPLSTSPLSLCQVVTGKFQLVTCKFFASLELKIQTCVNCCLSKHSCPLQLSVCPSSPPFLSFLPHSLPHNIDNSICQLPLKFLLNFIRHKLDNLLLVPADHIRRFGILLRLGIDKCLHADDDAAVQVAEAHEFPCWLASRWSVDLLITQHYFTRLILPKRETYLMAKWSTWATKEMSNRGK